MTQKHNYFQKYRKATAKIALVVLLVVTIQISPGIAQASSVTSFSDVLSRLKDSVAANHEIKFVTPTGVQDTNDTITFLMTGFTSASVDAITATDVDFAIGDSNNCTTATFTEEPVSGTSGSGATWGFDTNGANLMTLDPGTATVTADRCVRLRVGTNATSTSGSGPGVSQIVNGTAATAHTVTIGGVFGDSGTLSVDIITDDQVTISATVDPTITFTLTTGDNALGFGSLSSTAGRWADAAADGEPAVAGNTPTSAHTGSIATNAASGWVISYNGATLTAGSATIDPLTVAEDEDSEGDPGTEQFGIAVSRSGDATIAAGYERDANSDFRFIASTTTTILSESVPTATETLEFSYLANITGATEAGSYSTTITYIATGTF